MKNFKGFTLIELLIVIALLGALAVGLLAALDPFEQLKKGTDTGVRNTVSEVHGAIIRFYGIKNYMPWCNSEGENCADISGGVTIDQDSAVGTAMISAIVGTGELKKDFTQLAGPGTLKKIYVTGSNDDATVSVCYEPTSKSFLTDPNTKFNSIGKEKNGCPTIDGDPAADCFWCVK
ncbi:prepilin-type N-terminal cleavage/methylation domain-containing protein [Patescibacteria group bacterium]|nr:prepilin-type N-terminal cleavage/methylation domain-containing protein [Patescibacteria group bacterium]